MTKVIIFDFDGTLGDTRQNIVITLQRTMRDLNLELRDEATCVATIGLTLRDSFLAMYPDMSGEEADRCVEHYRKIFYDSIEELTPRPFANVVATLDKLYGQGIVLTVASSRSSPSLKLFMRDMSIIDYFSYILGSDNVTKHKPDAEPVLVTLEALGFKSSEAIVVGDMPVDVAMGRNAGVRTVAVSYGNASKEELVAAGADYVIDNLEELLPLV